MTLSLSISLSFFLYFVHFPSHPHPPAPHHFLLLSLPFSLPNAWGDNPTFKHVSEAFLPSSKWLIMRDSIPSVGVKLQGEAMAKRCHRTKAYRCAHVSVQSDTIQWMDTRSLEQSQQHLASAVEIFDTCRELWETKQTMPGGVASHPYRWYNDQQWTLHLRRNERQEQ